MTRFIRVSLLLAASLAMVATGAFANLPDPNFSTVPGVITITPDGSFAYTVNVGGALGPVNGAVVVLDFNNIDSPTAFATDKLVGWCVGQSHNEVVGSSNTSGDATFFVAGGGCIDAGRYAGASFIVQVRADGIVLGEIEVNSPDVVGSGGLLPTTFDADTRPLGGNNCNSGGTTEVGLSDAVFHTVPISLGSSELCTNFTGPDYNDAVALGDAVIVTPYITSGTSCACQLPWGP